MIIFNKITQNVHLENICFVVLIKCIAAHLLLISNAGWAQPLKVNYVPIKIDSHVQGKTSNYFLTLEK